MEKVKIYAISLLILITCSCGNRDDNRKNGSGILLSKYESSNIIDGEFDIPELNILPSPEKANLISFSKNEKVIDYDVSPAGRIVAIAIESESQSLIKFWDITLDEFSDTYSLPENFICKSIVWHPAANALFAMGSVKTEYLILRIENNSGEWINSPIYKSTNKIERLVSCPRPFITGFDTKTLKSHYEYRLFFGIEKGDKSYRIASITEHGNRFYQVVGPSNSFTSVAELDADIPPSEIESSWALPVAFHPAGHKLIWEDKGNNFHVATYDSRAWGDSNPIAINIKKGGTITSTPNGIGVIHWQRENSGIGLYLIPQKTVERQLTNYHFISNPSIVPDGKGVVGLTSGNGIYTLQYVPINMPLPDVLNAWMFIKTSEELKLFQDNYGLFRPNYSQQLYELYEAENYYCNGYDRSSPTRPYMVTTDIFWELFASAYQGLFIVKERDEAIPNFWQFVDKASSYYKGKKSKWEQVFAVLQEFRSTENSVDREVQNIYNASDAISKVTNENYQFSNLKPRGHYTSTPEMQKYFKAFRYFTTILLEDKEALFELESLPSEITKYAISWIGSYSGLIAPSRSNLVWKGLEQTLPTYSKYPNKSKVLFPLSWGFDNEVLYSTVYHQDLPEELQIKGPGGVRLLPSGLDIAAVFGSEFSKNFLQSDLEKYPPLKKVITNLRENYRNNSNGKDFKDNIYNRWLNAMAIQWADTVNSTNGLMDKNLWQTKRLQTGLATWATLRHATILVNERVAAECGEGGFEEILMRAPRGYVEPDPATFAAIANLFDKAIKYVPQSIEAKTDFYESGNTGKRSLYDGIVTRLKETAQHARSFQAMAEKERKGIELSNEENAKILHVAAVAEHLFLVFNSLSSEDYGLSNPVPMAKIADVSGDGKISPYLMAAVGNSIEWNHIVPFYGRHQIVKGAAYSYYEFESEKLLNDEEWREMVKNQEQLFWIKPYVTKYSARGMAETGY